MAHKLNPGRVLTVTITDSKGKTIATMHAMPKAFSTGSSGYYLGGKAILPHEGREDDVVANFQIGMNLTRIGSKDVLPIDDTTSKD